MSEKWAPPVAGAPWTRTDERRLQIALAKTRTQALTTTTASLTATLAHDVLLCDATGGAITVTLPVAAQRIKTPLWVKKIDATANAVTIAASGAETIDGAASVSFAVQYQSYTIVSDGVSKWWIV